MVGLKCLAIFDELPSLKAEETESIIPLADWGNDPDVSTAVSKINPIAKCLVFIVKFLLSRHWLASEL